MPQTWKTFGFHQLLPLWPSYLAPSPSSWEHQNHQYPLVGLGNSISNNPYYFWDLRPKKPIPIYTLLRPPKAPNHLTSSHLQTICSPLLNGGLDSLESVLLQGLEVFARLLRSCRSLGAVNGAVKCSEGSVKSLKNGEKGVKNIKGPRGWGGS